MDPPVLKGEKEKKKGRPAVLTVHGGPHTQYGWAFFHEFQLMAAQGYTVVFSNPRGSRGYGEDFCRVIAGDWGNKDWEDIQAVTAWMKALPGVDPNRMGVMGGSYGGYKTNWVIGHSKEFKAAITDRCVSNWISMVGTADFPMNKDEYFGGTAYGPISKIEPLWKQSPMSAFDRVEAPTLIIHSEGDLRCPIEQGDQVFAALQARGIESRFVRYPANTSHGLSRNGPMDMRQHRLGEILAWWKKHLG
jgi:dipeptidyl aminopeptidase/acylaminoacyl peptidase